MFYLLFTIYYLFNKLKGPETINTTLHDLHTKENNTSRQNGKDDQVHLEELLKSKPSVDAFKRETKQCIVWFKDPIAERIFGNVCRKFIAS